MTMFFAVLLLGALFLAIILNLAAGNNLRSQITGVCALIAACIGIIMYGCSMVYVYGLNAAAILRALLTVCRMFAAVNDLALIQRTPMWNNNAAMAVFWLGHFLAFYCTASTVVAGLGEKLLHRLRFLVLKHSGDLMIVFGADQGSVSYVRNRLKQKKMSVLFVESNCDSSLETAISAMNGIVDDSPSALVPNPAFLRHVGMTPGKRRLYAVAMYPDGLRNLTWSKQLLSALTKSGIDPQQTNLLLRGIPEQQAGSLLAQNSAGYGTVFAYDEYILAARLMIQKIPPCRTVSFDSSGLAAEDFSSVIIGFGKMGRTVLSYLIMNGQFCGSTFRADVFDDRRQKGNLQDTQLLQNHQICFHSCSGRSDDFYTFLRENREKLKYIVICTGSQRENWELAQDISSWYGDAEKIPVIVQITKTSLLVSENGCIKLFCQDLYQSDALDFEKLDKLAAVINQQYYQENGRTAEENWKQCDYFSRMSCRASADFAPALLKASGMTEEQMAAGDWHPSEEQMEHLAISEHMRWCAFYEVMGYHTMKTDIWEERAAAYRAEMASRGTSSVRIGKDTRNKLHACLIPWEELDALSEKENRVTGGHTDYKEMDRENVRALPSLLRMAAESKNDPA